MWCSTLERSVLLLPSERSRREGGSQGPSLGAFFPHPERDSVQCVTDGRVPANGACGPVRCLFLGEDRRGVMATTRGGQ